MEQTTILVVDDEVRYVRLISANLKVEGYNVLEAFNGKSAIDIIVEHEVDLVLLDIMMPLMSGFETCERIRSFSYVPIIMVTAKGDEKNRIQGLDVGADDYIVKPFSADELLARVRAVLRRSKFSREVSSPAIFEHGDLKIDFARAEVYRDGDKVLLSATEYRLLLQFAHNVGQVLASEELLTAVWGDGYEDDKEILWVTISRLRSKLESTPGNPAHIVTRTGLGYTMPRLYTGQLG
ncbi:MAG: DNA-binding response regulator [Anaerolineaceae bacterium 4572_5.1]|nr:MAG: DNA-binding response regulator [Anaerolineaceae bacterium 4572_5.1]